MVVDLRIAGQAAQGDHVRRCVALQHLARLGGELVDDAGHVFRRRVRALRLKRHMALHLRIGVVDAVAQVVAAKDDDETMFADRFDEDLHAGNADGLQFSAHGHAAFRGRPAGSAIGDLAGLVDRAEVAPDGDVAWPNLKVDAQRFQNAPADAIFERIVAEQPEMSGAAARRDARQDGNAQAADAFTYTGVQVRRASRLEFSFAAQFERKSTEAVGHDEDDFAVAGFTQFAN